ncbi:branched-chain amino acid transporter permease [Streptomyces bottropensis]|uniref:branched-chain amino acid transporter permease n=1 Tax=Streptomyces bottropensis TaxID=42235 RepID=UPI0036A791E0
MAAVTVSAAVTWALRALPFAVLAPLRSSEIVRPLLSRSTRMPAGVMLIPLVYCLRDPPLTEPRALAPAVTLAVTVGLCPWRRNAPPGILGGTATHVVLVSTVVAP